MNTTQVNAFLTLAEEENYGRAAKRLCISQGTLSKYIISLEKELNTVLIVRNGNPMRLTNAGKLVREYFLLIHDDIFAMSNQLKKYNSEKKEYLSIGFSSSFSQSGYLDKVVDFKEMNRNIDLHTIECKSILFTSLLDTYEIDLALGWSDVVTDSHFCKRDIFEDGWGLLVSTENPLSQYDEISLSDVKNEPFIMQNNEEKFVLFCQKSGFMPLIQHRFDTIASLIYAVKKNLGVAFSCRHMLPPKMPEDIKLLRLKERHPNNLVVITRNEKNSPTVELFINSFIAMINAEEDG